MILSFVSYFVLVLFVPVQVSPGMVVEVEEFFVKYKN